MLKVKITGGLAMKVTEQVGPLLGQWRKPKELTGPIPAESAVKTVRRELWYEGEDEDLS